MMNDIADIPDHAISNPFSLSNEKSTRAGERFERYKHYIIPWFKDLYEIHAHKKVFYCPVCNACLVKWNSSRVLAHLASFKHLRAALGDELEQDDKRNKRRVVKHRIYSTPAVVETVIADVGSGLGE
jgi:hypothetical protein